MPPSADGNLSEEVARLEDENAQLRQDLINARQRANSGVMRRGETIEVLSTDLYFESGSAQLTPEGVEKLESVAATLKREYPDRIIRVEGYTDDKPIGDKLKSRFPSNWELSTGRASAVVRHLQWTHEISPKRFEVVGFGPYQPIATNETAEGRRENRRVRIAVLPGDDPDAIDASNARSRSNERSGF
jgi:chemotaxis protein MotB